MGRKLDLSNFFWMAAGALVLLALILVTKHFHKEENPAAQIAFKARRVELVTRMRLDLASASEAEKSAVMAITDQDSQTYADQARSALAAVENGRGELENLLRAGGDKFEMDQLAGFSQAFAGFQRIEKELLELAVENTNLKAYSLAYGPAADAIKEMDGALSRVAAEDATSSRPDATRIMQLAGDARVGALRILALLPPHIAEESDQKMDELESRMAKEDLQVRTDLERLAALMKSGGGGSDLDAAAASYAKFNEIKAQIIRLSRENTNVRSLTLSLNQQRKTMWVCQDALAALEQAIREEPVSGETSGKFVYPR